MSSSRITKPTDPGLNHRFLAEPEKDGRYDNGKSQFWSESEQDWKASRNASGTYLTYRVCTLTHNPRKLECEKDKRFLRVEELDGRWNGKAEVYCAQTGMWVLTATTSDITCTYRITEEVTAPSSLGPEIVQNNRKLDTHEIDGRYAGIAEYWDTATSKWLRSASAARPEYTYRISTKVHNPASVYQVDLLDTHRLLRVEELDGRWDRKASVYDSATRTWSKTTRPVKSLSHTYMVPKEPVKQEEKTAYPEIPSKFKNQHVHYDDLIRHLAVYSPDARSAIMAHWNMQQIVGTHYYVSSEAKLVMTRPTERPDYKIIDVGQATKYPPGLVEYFGVGIEPAIWRKLDVSARLREPCDIAKVFKPTYYYRVSTNIHNPEGITPEEVGSDYTLLREDELDGRYAVEMKLSITWVTANGDASGCTYRRKKTEAELKKDQVIPTEIPERLKNKLFLDTDFIAVMLELGLEKGDNRQKARELWKVKRLQPTAYYTAGDYVPNITPRLDRGFIIIDALLAEKYPSAIVEYWNTYYLRWDVLGCSMGPKASPNYNNQTVYRVSSKLHNPANITHWQAGTETYRLLTTNEIDGRHIGKAEVYNEELKRWELAQFANRANLTYRLRIDSEPLTKKDEPINMELHLGLNYLEALNYPSQFLEFYSKSGQEWRSVSLTHTYSDDFKYRVSVEPNDPTGIATAQLQNTAGYRLLKKSEYDGRWNDKAEYYLPMTKTWERVPLGALKHDRAHRVKDGQNPLEAKVYYNQPDRNSWSGYLTIPFFQAQKYPYGIVEFWNPYNEKPAWNALRATSEGHSNWYYRVPNRIHNPEAWLNSTLLPNHRFLRCDELDGRWDGKALIYYPTTREWSQTGVKPNDPNWTYSIPIPASEKPKDASNYLNLTAAHARKYPPELIETYLPLGGWVKFTTTEQGKKASTRTIPSSINVFLENESYRVSMETINPEKVTDLGAPSRYRFLRADEYDGRWVDKAEFYYTGSKKWALMNSSEFCSSHTYRIEIAKTVLTATEQILTTISTPTLDETVVSLKSQMPGIFEKQNIYDALGILAESNKHGIFNSLLIKGYIRNIEGSNFYQWIEQEKQPKGIPTRQKLPALFTYQQARNVMTLSEFTDFTVAKQITQIQNMDLYKFED